ncbi:MAG: ceramidase domain-containing protein [Alphaproteobacteria bacterium]|nr:ceramidase domain-containing protein [Alphaproteobacteria bacterium]
MNSVDLYCERVGAGFWAEPINALTNMAFILAAWGVWRLSSRSSTFPPGIWVLLATAVAIGVGSFAFHTVAKTWARILDIVPILFFQLAFLWHYGRQIIALKRSTMVVALMAYLAASIAGRQFPALLNGSLIYAPTILAILGIGIYHAKRATIARFDLLAAAALLAAALLFRSIDNAVCATLPIGTHFLWHLSNAVVVYLVLRALVLRHVNSLQQAFAIDNRPCF